MKVALAGSGVTVATSLCAAAVVKEYTTSAALPPAQESLFKK